MRKISYTLLAILIKPRLIIRVRTVAEIIREFWASHSRKPDCTWEVKSGTSAGMDRTKARVTAPLMMPTTKAATIAIR